MRGCWVLAALACFYVCVAAETRAESDEWTDGDTWVQAGVSLTLAADWMTTRSFCEDALDGDGASFSESNPVIGPKCGGVSPNVYFPVVLVGHAAVTRLLPKTWMRRAFQGLTIGFQVRAINTNLSAGYAIRW